MNVLDFFRAVSAGSLKNVKNIYKELDGKVPLNKNLTYACGATWVIPLPLVTAFQRGYYDIARFLIDKGADLDAVCQKSQKSPRDFMPHDFLIENKKHDDIDKDFFQKIRGGDLEAVKSFMTEHPNTVLNENLVIKNKLYPLPLAVAIKKKRNDIAEFLIGQGASLKAYCKKNEDYVEALQAKNKGA